MQSENEDLWYQFLVEGNFLADKSRAIFRALPDDPLCMACRSPFEGFGGRLMSIIGKERSREDPRFCNA